MRLDQRITLFRYEEKHEETFKDQLLSFQLPPEQAEFTDCRSRRCRMPARMPAKWESLLPRETGR